MEVLCWWFLWLPHSDWTNGTCFDFGSVTSADWVAKFVSISKLNTYTNILGSFLEHYITHVLILLIYVCLKLNLRCICGDCFVFFISLRRSLKLWIVRSGKLSKLWSPYNGQIFDSYYYRGTVMAAFKFIIWALWHLSELPGNRHKKSLLPNKTNKRQKYTKALLYGAPSLFSTRIKYWVTRRCFPSLSFNWNPLVSFLRFFF